MNTWFRYLFFRFLALVTGLTLLTFCLFIFVDLLSHIKDLFDPHTTWKMWRAYYLGLLIYRLESLVPFSIAAATAIFLPKLIRTNELIPLLTSGISLRQILQPFIAVTALATCLLWVNNQFIYPKLIKRYHFALDSDFGRETVPPTTSRLGVVLFPEGSRLFFGTYDQRRQCIEDVFWVRSPDCVVHIENLRYFIDRQPEGRGIDVIERAEDGKMRKTASYDLHDMAELKINKEILSTATATPSDLSITQLSSFLSRAGSFRSERSVETTLALYHKLLFPLLALLAFLIPAPLCLRIEHRIPQAILVFLSLASLFCFMLVVQASFVLAKAPLFPVMPVVLLPWCVAFFVALRRVFRLS